MIVSQVIDIAREWVQIHGSQTPRFLGAHLLGAINSMKKDDPFPTYRDVDLVVICEKIPKTENREYSYKGLLIECASFDAERYNSPDAVLSDPALAGNIAVDSILDDSSGTLQKLHEVVSQEYPRRKWVLARCSAQRDTAERGLKAMAGANSFIEALRATAPWVWGLTGLIADANLRLPTHRRCLILAKELLQKWQEEEIQEKLLHILGYANLTLPQAEAYLQDCAETFDRAVQVSKSNVPFGFKLHSHVRPYIVEGAAEMIHEGYHREAMPWIRGFLVVANGAIQVDAPQEERSHYQAKLDRLNADVGWNTLADVEKRLQPARELTASFFQVADDIVERNPEIID